MDSTELILLECACLIAIMKYIYNFCCFAAFFKFLLLLNCCLNPKHMKSNFKGWKRISYKKSRRS